MDASRRPEDQKEKIQIKIKITGMLQDWRDTLSHQHEKLDWTRGSHAPLLLRTHISTL